MGGQQDSPTLSQLVTETATSLMAVGPSGLVETCQLVLRRLVSHFDVDLGFVRRNDHQAGTTVLLAEWPPRADVPDPDPLGVVSFADADPVFAALENLTEVLVARPDAEDTGYQQRVQEGSGVPAVSSVTVPMVRGGVTTGVLGLVAFGDRAWPGTEVAALSALAGLLAQALSRETAEARLRYLAYRDELTGLSNRQALLDHLEERLEPGRSGPVAVVLLSVDRFKAVNDFLGHAAGDDFLRCVASRLGEHASSTDHLARLGGDEFVVVPATPMSAQDAAVTARSAQQVIAAPVRLGAVDVSRTVSVGVTAGRPGLSSASGLLAEAEQAATAVRARGGNGTVRFTEQMRVGNDERADVEVNLRAAIGNGELELHYQPQIDLISGTLLGAEALVRWNHPARGLLGPDAFVEVAELTNLAGELGRWVLNAACGQLALWQGEFDLPDFRLGINVSAAQLVVDGLATDVANALRSSGVDARNVVLEVTETAVVADVTRAQQTLQAVTDLGVHIALDDFGTGYSSFAQLKTLPVGTLKIDRVFVAEIAHNRVDQAIVRAVIELARSVGLRTMAEGVETAEARTTLIELGCHEAQGYFIARPTPADGMRRLLQNATAHEA